MALGEDLSLGADRYEGLAANLNGAGPARGSGLLRAKGHSLRLVVQLVESLPDHSGAVAQPGHFFLVQGQRKCRQHTRTSHEPRQRDRDVAHVDNIRRWRRTVITVRWSWRMTSTIRLRALPMP